VTAAWAAAAMLDALHTEVARDLDDEHADRQMALEQAAAKLTTIAAAFHAAADELEDGDGIEPYCATCGAWIGVFYGLAGWRHFRGDPAPGGQRELYDEAHEAVPAWCVPPGRALSPAEARAVGQALADGIAYRLDRTGGCADCQNDPDRACPDHADDTSRALAYRQLAAELARMLPGTTGEDR
jgi:hypothetical protein